MRGSPEPAGNCVCPQLRPLLRISTKGSCPAIPILPQLTCLPSIQKREGNQEKREEWGGKGSEALYCKKKRFVSPGSLPPSLPPLKQLAAILKSRAGEIRQRRWGRRRKPSVPSLGCDLRGRGVVLASDNPLYWGGTVGL